MRTKLIKLLFLAFSISYMSTFAQTENTDVFANIVSPISISEASSLHFGSMSVSASPGTCVLTSAGSRLKTGGVTLGSTAPTATSASYNVSGSANMSYAITLPAGSITVTRVSGTETMTVSTFTSSKVGNAGLLNSSSLDNFTVGATLNVSASQTGGLYQGNFNITVAYN